MDVARKERLSGEGARKGTYALALASPLCVSVYELELTYMSRPAFSFFFLEGVGRGFKHRKKEQKNTTSRKKNERKGGELGFCFFKN